MFTPLDAERYSENTHAPPRDDDAAREVDDLRDAAMRLLDFDEIRRRLASHATFYEARTLALALAPSADAYEVERRQRETADARALLDEIDDLDLQSDTDTSESVTRAALGGALSGEELLAVAASLEVHRRARGALSAAERVAPMMAELAALVPDLRGVQGRIRSKIGLRGEVADDATPTLRALRRQVVAAYERVNEALQRFIRSADVRDALQDPVISARGDRLVVPVKADRRRSVPGIVHDASNTGATVFVEPFSTVELCNEWRELALEERREELRVLRDLSTMVGESAAEIRAANATVAKMDFALARARYARRLGATAPAIGERVRLIRARHPLLDRNAVPLTLNMEREWSTLVITGPNTGGKTVAMKTVGLAALMHQSGLQIPADEGCGLPVFDGVFADIGDQQSVAESVSTFGSHMRNVVRILRRAGSRSLVLLDEVGASTDPEEGSALAKAIIARLARGGVASIATTHHRNVAAFAEASERVMNASFQLDPDTLEPTYEMTVGVPGRSYAMAVAERLGLPAEILEEARSLIEPRHLLFEDWLNELQRERRRIQESAEGASRARAEAESLRQELERQVDYLVTRRDDMLDAARREAMARFREASRRLEGAEAALKWASPTPSQNQSADAPDIRERLARARQEMAAVDVPAPVQARRREKAVSRPLAAGDDVFIRGMNLTGRITDMNGRGGDVEVTVGRARISVDVYRLSRIERDDGGEEEESGGAPQPAAVTLNLAPSMESAELDLRGMRAADAQIKLDEFLDHAARDGVSRLRVIHGRGAGVLRSVAREHLRYHRGVSGFGAEPRERGGDGATWVELA